MKKLWKLSLVVLLLGNGADSLASYLWARQAGIACEANPLARWTMEHLGLFTELVLIKLVLWSVLLIVVIHRVRSWSIRTFGSWVGVGFAATFAFFFGIQMALGGTGQGDRILLAILPTRLIYLMDLFGGWIRWTVIVVIGTFLFLYFPSFAALTILLFLDKRKQRNSA